MTYQDVDDWLSAMIIEFFNFQKRLSAEIDERKNRKRDLFAVLKTKFFFEENIARNVELFPKEQNGYALTTPTEEQMQIKLDGVSINSKPRADGRYQGYVMDGAKKQYFYGRTYEAVAEKIKDFLQGGKIPQKKQRKSTVPTFGEYVENWIEIYKAPNLKPTSLSSLKNALKPALEVFRDKKLDVITEDDVQKLLLSIKSPRIRDLCNTYICSIFKRAAKKRIIKFNPCDLLEIKRHKSEHKNALTLEQQKAFFAATASLKYSLLYRFLTATGLRIGEALALLKSDVDFTACTVHVSKNVVFINGQRIEQDTPKTAAGNRTVPIPKNLCEELRKIETELIFPFTYNSVHCSIRRTAKELGFPVSLHILRHTYATRLEEAGIPPKIKQYLLGHASLEMTQNVYTDTQETYINSLSDKIRDLFKGDFDT